MLKLEKLKINNSRENIYLILFKICTITNHPSNINKIIGFFLLDFYFTNNSSSLPRPPTAEFPYFHCSNFLQAYQ